MKTPDMLVEELPKIVENHNLSEEEKRVMEKAINLAEEKRQACYRCAKFENYLNGDKSYCLECSCFYSNKFVKKEK